jgi:hypothetical protein
MSRSRTTQRLNKAEGFARIASHLQSGLSPSSYYKQHNLSEHPFYNRRKKYLAVHPDLSPSKAKSSSGEKRLHEVKTENRPLYPTGQTVSGVGIHYPDGVKVIIPAGNRMDIETFYSLIKPGASCSVRMHPGVITFVPTVRTCARASTPCRERYAADMCRDPLSGEIFILTNRSRTTVKLPHRERGGPVLYHKRLEKGRFSLPVFDEKSKSYHLERHDLVLMAEGISLEKIQRKKRFENSTKTG